MQPLTPRNPYNPIDGIYYTSCIIYFYLFLDAMQKKEFPEALDRNTVTLGGADMWFLHVCVRQQHQRRLSITK